MYKRSWVTSTLYTLPATCTALEPLIRDEYFSVLFDLQDRDDRTKLSSPVSLVRRFHCKAYLAQYETLVSISCCDN